VPVPRHVAQASKAVSDLAQIHLRKMVDAIVLGRRPRCEGATWEAAQSTVRGASGLNGVPAVSRVVAETGSDLEHAPILPRPMVD